jgi:DNA-binding NtrC family response regulator
MSPASRSTVLIADDHENQRRMLRGTLEDEGHEVVDVPDARAALAVIERRPFDAVVLDVNMPGMDGLTALGRIADLDPQLAVVIVTGETLIQQAREAVRRLGAFDVLAKMPEPEDLIGVVGQAVELTRRRRGAQPAGAGTAPGGAALGILGHSPALTALLEQVRRVAASQGRVLITGENGSGKELVAEAIHRLSKRADGPFVKLNCAAIPRDLVESELFGYERGAFTGAAQPKQGRLEVANGGTLFLDEVGDLSIEAQAKLLRAIETGEVERLGGTRSARFDVRIVSATNKDLQAAVQDGEFRQDLYYRLNVLPVHVPPLRERRGDVAPLAEAFLARICETEQRPVKTLDGEARALLEEYHWPGNVRELRNLMERAAVLVDGERVTAGDLTPWLDDGPAGPDAVGLRGEIERREADAIRRALDAANWNVTQAAAGLGIDRTNLHRKMRKYGIARRPGGA